MALKRRIKTDLDETRMLVLGLQILIGFQLNSAFQPRFALLATDARWLAVAALLLLILALGLLVLPSLLHRIVARGRISPGLHAAIGRLATVALAPFALSLAIGIGISGDAALGRACGVAAGLGAGILALGSWYGIVVLRPRREAGMETDRKRDDAESEPELGERIDQMLTEARVVLPGAQALLGFQLTIVFTEAFGRLPDGLPVLHGAALLLVTLAMVMLMTPAALHRIAYRGRESPDLLRQGGRLVTGSTVPLALGLAADGLVVVRQMTGSLLIAGVAGAFILCLLVGLWHVLPAVLRHRAACRDAGARGLSRAAT